MANITAHLAFESMMQKIEILDLMVLLVTKGAIPQSDGIKYFLDLAERCRAPENDHCRDLADLKARHYEDMASKMSGGDFLPRG